MYSANRKFNSTTYDDYYDDNDDYYDDNDDYNIKSNPISKNNSPSKKKKVNTNLVICEVCNCSISKSNIQIHNNSKKHRAALIDARIKRNQQQYEKKQKKQLEKERQRRKETSIILYTDSIIEHIASFISPKNLLSKRLICKKWNEILSNPLNIERIYYLTNKQVISIATQTQSSLKHYPLALIPTFSCIFSDQSVLQFVKKCKTITSQIDLTLIIYPKNISNNYWKRLCEIFPLLQVQVLKLYFYNNTKQKIIVKSKYIPQIFLKISENPYINMLETFINVKFKVLQNPLVFLNNSKSLRSIELNSNWFQYIKEKDNLGVLEKEQFEKSQEFIFSNSKTRILSIKSDSFFGEYRANYLLNALQSHRTLENLYLCNLGIDSSLIQLNLENIIDNCPLKELDLSRNNSIDKIRFNSLANHQSLAILNLSKTFVGTISNMNWKTNQSIQHLYLNECSLRNLTKQSISSLPRNLITLNLSNNALSYSSVFSKDIFDDFAFTHPKLITLNISCNFFLEFKSITKYLSETTSLRTFFIFEGSFVKHKSMNSLIETNIFNENKTITTCDHNKTNEYALTLDNKLKLDKIMKRNASTSYGRRTKGIR